LTFSTYDEDSDRIAIILQGCRNADRLDLHGFADISLVLTSISDSCRQLVGLTLAYDGQVTRQLLQSCPLLKTLSLSVVHLLDTQVYEQLVLLGGKLTELVLGRETSELTQNLTFLGSNSKGLNL
jgi:hypothetical protein